MKQPKKEDYGWQSADSFDGESGWMIEGGEEKYNEAIKKWLWPPARLARQADELGIGSIEGLTEFLEIIETNLLSPYERQQIQDIIDIATSRALAEIQENHHSIPDLINNAKKVEELLYSESAFNFDRRTNLEEPTNLY